jgi:flagellar motor switch protein FliM
MSDGTLSLDEIMDLLNTVNAAGTADKKDAQDFTERPNKFSREHLRTISIIHEKFALMANKSLSDQLGAKVNITLASVDQLYMEEFFRSIPVPTTLGVINMEPLNGITILEIDPAIITAIIKKIGGGSGEQNEQWYELTIIEKKIIEGIFDCIFKNLQEAWSEVIDLRPRLEKIEPDPKFIRNVSPSEWVALVTLETKMLDAEGMINFCIPYPVIEPILEKL